MRVGFPQSVIAAIHMKSHPLSIFVVVPLFVSGCSDTPREAGSSQTQGQPTIAVIPRELGAAIIPKDFFSLLNPKGTVTDLDEALSGGPSIAEANSLPAGDGILCNVYWRGGWGDQSPMNGIVLRLESGKELTPLLHAKLMGVDPSNPAHFPVPVVVNCFQVPLGDRPKELIVGGTIQRVRIRNSAAAAEELTWGRNFLYDKSKVETPGSPQTPQ